MRKKYVEQVTTINTVVHKSYFTDENGYLILPESLKCGNYRDRGSARRMATPKNTQPIAGDQS